MDKWGSTLRKRYGKTLDKRESDMTANYLSYWTDNGAFYYYHTDQNDVYEDQLEKIAKQDIPFQPEFSKKTNKKATVDNTEIVAFISDSRLSRVFP